MTSRRWKTWIPILALGALGAGIGFNATSRAPKVTFNTIDFDPAPNPDYSPQTTIEYDGRLVGVAAVRSGSGVKVSGVADGVAGRVVLDFVVSGGQVGVPPGCVRNGSMVSCEVEDDAVRAAVPFVVELPVTDGSGPLTVQVAISTADDTGVGGSLDIDTSNNTVSVAVPAAKEI